MNNNNKRKSLDGHQAQVRRLEDIYGVSIGSAGDLRALSDYLEIPVDILLMPVGELREVVALLR